MWKCASQLAGGSTSVGREGWARGGAQVGMRAPAICTSGIVIPDNHSVADRGNCRGVRPTLARQPARGVVSPMEMPSFLIIGRQNATSLSILALNSLLLSVDRKSTRLN